MALFVAVHYHEIELSTNILLRAGEVRDYYFVAADETGHGSKMMDLGDAIHLATATLYGATEFQTRDKSKKGSKVRLFKLYEISGNPQLCGKWDLKIVSPESSPGNFDV